MRRSIHRVAICAALAATPTVSAEPLGDFQTWTSVAVAGSLHEAWRYNVDLHLRFGDDSDRYSQGILRPGIGYALNERASLWVGYAYVQSDAPFATQRTDEHRVWQQFTWTQPTSLGAFVSRTRLEQRDVETGDDTGWRLRQMLRLTHPLAYVPRTSVVASNEMFFHLNDTDWGARTGFDQNRVFAGLGYDFSTRLRGEAGYLNLYQHREDRADRLYHMLSLNFTLRF